MVKHPIGCCGSGRGTSVAEPLVEPRVNGAAEYRRSKLMNNRLKCGCKEPSPTLIGRSRMQLDASGLQTSSDPGGIMARRLARLGL